MQAFDVNAGAFIEPVNSGRHSACYLAMTFHRLNVYALHVASSSSSLFSSSWKVVPFEPEPQGTAVGHVQLTVRSVEVSLVNGTLFWTGGERRGVMGNGVCRPSSPPCVAYQEPWMKLKRIASIRLGIFLSLMRYRISANADWTICRCQKEYSSVFTNCIPVQLHVISFVKEAVMAKYVWK